MNTKSLIFVIGIIGLFSCGRTNNAFIINRTDDTITIGLKLNYPANQFRPDNYFREEIIKKEKSTVENYKLAGDCIIKYDSISEFVVLRLNPHDKLNLGTIRVGLSRDDYRTWEFTDIQINSDNFEILAKNNGIMNLIKKDQSMFSQNSHYLMIGEE